MGERQKLKAKKLLPFDHKGILAQEAQVYKDFTHILDGSACESRSVFATEKEMSDKVSFEVLNIQYFVFSKKSEEKR